MSIGPFSPHNLLLVAKLHRVSDYLFPVEMLTSPRSPIWRALMSLLAFEETQTWTYVLDDSRRDGKQLQGFVQAIQSTARSEVYVHCLAPRLAASQDAPAVWHRLLTHLVSVAGERGIQRVFSCVPEDSDELEVMLNVGFNAYTREDVFCLEPDSHPQAVKQNGVRPEQDTDAWDIKRLYDAVAPHLVRQVELSEEGPDQSGGYVSILGAQRQGEGFVLRDRDGVAGYGCLTPGRIGHWLTIQVHPRAYDQTGDLLDYGLALLNYYPPHPVYCQVREYQAGVRAPLMDRGFHLLSTYCCLVKHTMVWVKEPARNLVHALEKRAEARPSAVSSGKTYSVTVK